MADFDAIRKEVEQLEARHLELTVLKPKLEEEITGLKEELQRTQQTIVSAQEEYDALLITMAIAEKDHYERITNSEERLRAEQASFEEYKSKKLAEIDEKSSQLFAAQNELKDKENELANLLEQQVAGEKAIEQQMSDMQKVMANHFEEVSKLRKEKEAFANERKALDEQIATIEQMQTTIDSSKKKVAEMAAEAQSKLKAADAMLAEAKERNNLVSLKEDEVLRKEQLIQETTKRLRKREAAINDKERVYNSQRF